MPRPGIIYKSADQSSAQPSGKPQRRFPLPDDSSIQLAAYAFDQDYEMALSSFPPAPKNTPSTSAALGSLGDANAILTSYTDPATTGGGLGRFTARFNIVPASWVTETEMPFTFPAFPGYLGDGTARDPIVKTVNMRREYDYFVLDPTGVLGAPMNPGDAPAPGSINDSGGNAILRVNRRLDIPIINKSLFYWLVNGIPDFSKVTNAIIPAAGVRVQIGWVTVESKQDDGSTLTQTIPQFQTYLPTLPTREVYLAWLANAQAHGWASTVWDGVTEENAATTTTGQMVAEDSKTDVHAGNIISRVTTYVLVR
jgi:hypothetical protein